jgi:hypothetical protein
MPIIAVRPLLVLDFSFCFISALKLSYIQYLYAIT